MATRRSNTKGANALKRPIEVTVSGSGQAPAETIYALLADPASHLEWAGQRQAKKTRLLSVGGPPGPIGVGDEFATTGADPMGRFADRSVVTEATPSSAFEFVTEAALTTKKGEVAEWTNIHRYEITPEGERSRVTYTLRVTRISALPGMLAIFNWPVLSGLAVRASSTVAKRGVRNVTEMAEERTRN